VVSACIDLGDGGDDDDDGWDNNDNKRDNQERNVGRVIGNEKTDGRRGK
jgi:hypothetical protein